MSISSGAALAAAGSPLDAYPSDFNRQEHVNYVGTNDAHVHELFL